MKLLASHLAGNANVKAAVNGFIEAGLLGEFHVTIASIPGTLLDSLGGLSPFSEIRRRRFDPMVKPFLHSWPWLEIGRVLSKGKLRFLAKNDTSPFFVDRVIQNLDKHVASSLEAAQKKGVNAVYAYEDIALHTFQGAKNLGLKCIYDLPIGYWRAGHRLLELERQRWPEWAVTMHGLRDSEEKLLNKDEELRLADLVFVASTFTADSLKDYPGKLPPVEVIPYGFPPVHERKSYTGLRNSGPLKLLFVGSLSQRKGVADLLEAVDGFGSKVELTLVGKKTTEECAPLNKALTRHRWIPSLSHSEILKLMRESDVFVFPSLFEGFGLVITEAMSQGTPVITTDRTAGPDIIDHGSTGWLIKAGTTNALKESIEALLLKPEMIKEVGLAAREKARQRPWEMYGRELARSLINKSQSNG